MKCIKAVQRYNNFLYSFLRASGPTRPADHKDEWAADQRAKALSAAS